MSIAQKLDELLKKEHIRYFSGREFFTRTMERPPEAWLPRIVPVAVFAEKLRRAMGHPLSIGWGYRDPDTNKRVGGAKFSAHKYFRAADIDLPVHFRTWENRVKYYQTAVRLWLETGGEPYGLGIYAPIGGSRVHIDYAHKPWPFFRSRRCWKKQYVDRIADTLVSDDLLPRSDRDQF